MAQQQLNSTEMRTSLPHNNQTFENGDAHLLEHYRRNRRDSRLSHARHGLIHYILHMRIRHLIAILVLIFMLVSFVAHSFLTALDSRQQNGGDANTNSRRPKMVQELLVGNSKLAPDLKSEIEELKRIRMSVNNELRDLDLKRQQLKSEIVNFTQHRSVVEKQYEQWMGELESLRLRVSMKEKEHEDLAQHYTPKLDLPAPILPSLPPRHDVPRHGSPFFCRLHNCFDYSRCSLTSRFPVFVYNTVKSSALPRGGVHAQQLEDYLFAFAKSRYVTSDPKSACVYVVYISKEYLQQEANVHSKADLEDHLRGLAYWGSDGRNHLLLHVENHQDTGTLNLFDNVNIGRAMLAQTSFTDVMYRREFDVIVPPYLFSSLSSARNTTDVWQQLQPIVPARRKHLLSFHGEMPFLQHFTKPTKVVNERKLKASNSIKSSPHQDAFNTNNSLVSDVRFKSRNLQSASTGRSSTHGVQTLVDFERAIVQSLKILQQNYPVDGFQFRFTCDNHSDVTTQGSRVEWRLCDKTADRVHLLQASTFALIIAPLNNTIVTSLSVQTRVFEALKAGAVPVILGSNIRLPFEALLSWKQAVIVLPKQRVTELHFLLRSLSDADVLELRRQGRILWSNHLSSVTRTFETLLGDVRSRLNIPPLPVTDEPSPSVFNSSFHPKTEQV